MLDNLIDGLIDNWILLPLTFGAKFHSKIVRLLFVAAFVLWIPVIALSAVVVLPLMFVQTFSEFVNEKPQ